MVHYVAPTVWAWKKYRAKIFANLYDQLFVLLNLKKNILMNMDYILLGWTSNFFDKVNIKKKI